MNESKEVDMDKSKEGEMNKYIQKRYDRSARRWSRFALPDFIKERVSSLNLMVENPIYIIEQR